MLVGGCAGSTTCGIKIFRLQILYQAAKVRFPIWALYIIGGIPAITMIIFTLNIIRDIYMFAIIGLFLGTVLYSWGRYRGRKEGFDYEARMEADYHLLEQ